MKLSSPRGFFLTLLTLTVNTYFLALGVVALMTGGALLCQTQLDWSPSVGHFLVSIGLAVIFVRYLNLCLLQPRSRYLNLLLCLTCLAFMVGHYQSHKSTMGIILMGDRPVETVMVYHGGTNVAQHLGAPLGVIETENGVPTVLGSGVDNSEMVALGNYTARTPLSRWYLEPLGYRYREGGLRALLRIEQETSEPVNVSIGLGKTVRINQELDIRLSALEPMGLGQGHRMLVELFGASFGDTGKQQRFLYDYAPNLEKRIGAEFPRVSALRVEHEPAHAFYLYEREPSISAFGRSLAMPIPMLVFVLLACVTIGFATFGRAHSS